MLDRDGYRPNVGILLLNAHNDVFWGKRVNQHAWQFPQGGIKAGESPEQAMFRELEEEVGLKPEHVRNQWRVRPRMRTCSGLRPTSSPSSRNIACSGDSPDLMPPCGNCHAC